MKSSRLFAVLAALLAAVSASAQQATPLQSYDVELLVFRTLNPNTSPEEWSMEAAAAGQRLAIPEDEPSPFAASEPAPVPAAATFPALAPAKFKLSAIADTLRRSRNYQPLAHFGWTQPGYPRGDAKYLPINAMVPAGSGLVGQVALSRGRYLHLTLDLVYDAPGAAGEATQRFVLRQSRRMRSNERHYIDSPRFGVIAIITPSAPSG
jgi:hypothetical protein